MIPAGTELRCAAMLFDLDGVLVDSAAAVERSWRRWAARHDLPEADVLRLCHGRPSAETIAIAAARAEVDLDAAAEAERLEREQVADTAGLAACSGAALALSALPDRCWAVVTSGGRPVATSRLRGAGLPVPAVLVTADDVRRGKPDPEGYRTAARLLRVPPEQCVVVEDAHPGVLAARAAGCGVIGVAGPFLGSASDVDIVVGSLSDVDVSVRDRTVSLRDRRAVLQ